MDNMSTNDIATALECCFKNMDGEDCCSSCAFNCFSHDSCYRMLFTSTISCISDLQARLSLIQALLDNVSDDLDSIRYICKQDDSSV